MKEELKQAIEKAAEDSFPLHYKFPGNNRNDFLAYHTAKQQGYQHGAKDALNNPEWLRHADPEILKQAGWVREEDIKTVLDELIDLNNKSLEYLNKNNDTGATHRIDDPNELLSFNRGKNAAYCIAHGRVKSLLPQPPNNKL